MKMIAIALVSLVASAASANTCSPYWTTNGGEELVLVYPCGIGARVTPLACQEGRTEIVAEVDGNDHTTFVHRTCRNGAFVASKPVVHTSCQEGRTEIFLETDNDHTMPVHYTCRGGRFVRN